MQKEKRRKGIASLVFFGGQFSYWMNNDAEFSMEIWVLFLIPLPLSIVLRSLYRVCSLSVSVFLKYSNESGDCTLICF